MKKVDAESLWPPPKFLANVKIQLNTASASRLSSRFLWLWYYVLVGFVYSAIFLPKRKNQITFRTMLENFKLKNIKMRAPVALFNLFKKSSVILHLFLKAKSQAKAYIIKTVVCCLRKRKDVKKTVKKKIGKSFLELTCFIFYLSFKLVLRRLGFYCLLSVFYLWFVRSSHWEVFVK